MITLNNGDKWIVDYDLEVMDKKITYEQSLQNIPETTQQDFVNTLIHKPSVIPLVLKHSSWLFNSNYKQEILQNIAVEYIENEFANIYLMPWGNVIVQTDKLTKYQTLNDYNKAATFIPKNHNDLKLL